MSNIALETADELRRARLKAVAWLSERVRDDGEPFGADKRNSWWRAPWALAVGGAPDVASAMLGWIERNALTEDGDLKTGVYGGGSQGSNVYQLSPIAIAAHLLGRYDLSRHVMAKLEQLVDPETGGAFDRQDFAADPVQETLKTAQFGVSALVTGRWDSAKKVRAWLDTQLQQQDEAGVFYPAQQAGAVVKRFDPAEQLVRRVDFSAPRQMYFFPGIAAAFLAGYAQHSGDADALDLADRYLQYNASGTEEQFTDVQSVQICKFGWGLAMQYGARPTESRLRWLIRMSKWFIQRQNPDGSWAPSSFTCAQPELPDFYWKTAEHLMEVAYMESSLRQRPFTTG